MRVDRAQREKKGTQMEQDKLPLAPAVQAKWNDFSKGTTTETYRDPLDQEFKVGEIMTAIPKIMAKMEAVAKGKKNQDQGFMYRGIEDIYNALQKVMAEEGVFSTMNMVARKDNTVKSAKGYEMRHAVITFRFRFFAKDGSFVTTLVDGEGLDMSDKVSGKCASYAHKYAMLTLFSIPTKDMTDPDGETPGSSEYDQRVQPPRQQHKPRTQNTQTQPKAQSTASEPSTQGRVAPTPEKSSPAEPGAKPGQAEQIALLGEQVIPGGPLANLKISAAWNMAALKTANYCKDLLKAVSEGKKMNEIQLNMVIYGQAMGFIDDHGNRLKK